MHTITLDPRQDQLSKPLAASLVFHLSIVALVGGFTWLHNKDRIPIGDPNAGPGGATVDLVESIPGFRQSRQVEKVANETESQTPSLPKPQVQPREEEDDPDAISLKSNRKQPKKKTKKQPVAKMSNQKRLYTPDQLYSSTRARVSTPMLAPAKGGGGIGLGSSNPFGTRLGWYADLIRQRVAEKWRTQDLDARLNDLEAIVTFDIRKDGSVTNIRLIQRSGNYSVDTSAMRAIGEASPLPPLPKEFERTIASVEFQFKLQR
ncbi:MAG: TonB family protein [Bryobacterales bacterium]|nr:TonB family protein [Bryobacterales bacterium]